VILSKWVPFLGHYFLALYVFFFCGFIKNYICSSFGPCRINTFLVCESQDLDQEKKTFHSDLDPIKKESYWRTSTNSTLHFSSKNTLLSVLRYEYTTHLQKIVVPFFYSPWVKGRNRLLMRNKSNASTILLRKCRRFILISLYFIVNGLRQLTVFCPTLFSKHMTFTLSILSSLGQWVGGVSGCDPLGRTGCG
jgi:hypothetical protein